MQTLTVMHVPGDPLQKDDLDTKLDMKRYSCNMLAPVCILTLQKFVCVHHYDVACCHLCALLQVCADGLHYITDVFRMDINLGYPQAQ